MAEHKPKRVRLDCLIHYSSQDHDSVLVSPQSENSWKTLLRAAEIRKHAQVLDLAKDLPDGSIPTLTYHRGCRSIFTMKRDLDAILAQQRRAETTDRPESKRIERKEGHASRVYEAKCIFCDSSNKYLKGKRTREVLTQCCELRADAKIRQVAMRKQDTKILAIVTRELVAAEGHYHRSCYRFYTKEDNAKPTSSTESDVDSVYEEAEKLAYREVFTYIREELFVKQGIKKMKEIADKLVTSMNNLGITKLSNTTKKHIKRRLESEFGETLHFVSDEKGKLLVYPDNLTIDNLVRDHHALQEKLHLLESKSQEDILENAAMQLRGNITEQDWSRLCPPDITKYMNNSDIPPSLIQFLRVLLTGKLESTNPKCRVQRLICSFSQDLIYAITSGKVKPMKHILLPFAVKSLTGNVELVQMLNRLGHGVSHSQVQEIDTALCLHKLSQSEGQVPLPKNIHNGIFSTVAWDNIDRLEETLSGEGTSHRVNGIVVQAQGSNVSTQDPEVPHPSVHKTKKRSICVDPLLLPTYNAGKRANPPITHAVEADTSDAVNMAHKKNIMWILTRVHQADTELVPSWTGFNILARDEISVVQDSVGYLPTINAPATQMSTVNEALNQTTTIMKELQLNSIVCVFDQALYAKATEIVWKHPEKYKGIILRLGTFHTICALLATIGKRFQDAGLKDLCVEAGVVAAGSVDAVMDGKKYNRAVRVHKLLYEALMQLAWKGFLHWLETEHKEDLIYLDEVTEILKCLTEEVSQATEMEVAANSSFQYILKRFDVYLGYLRQDNGPLSTFWMSYISLVEIMLGLIRATREGNWLLHLASVREMIPWCFAYDRLNYARYLPIYYAQMSRLATDHPDIHSEFMKGKFSVQLGTANPFGRIPVDQTLEETINKDTQTPGGTKGFSLKHGAVSRYYLTAEYRSSYLRQLRDMIRPNHESSQKFSHPDLQPNRIKKDEKDIEAFVELMEKDWLNPLSHNENELVNLSTGVIAPSEVVVDILEAHNVGEKAYEKFKLERLETDPPTKKFHDRITRANLKTFSHMTKKQTDSKTHGKLMVLKADRNLFSHMILVAQSRALPIREVLAHPLGPLPWALANSDGSLRKTNKSALARDLEKLVSPADNIPEPSACIIDGMSLIHKLKGEGKTFEQLAESALNLVLCEGSTSLRIDVVFDVYRTNSIKNAERCNRGSVNSTQGRIIATGHKIIQWNKLLRNSESKTNLIQFLVEQWKSPSKRKKLDNKTLYVTCGEICIRITMDVWDEVTSLNSLQEEADTRLFLHASHAADEKYASVIVAAEDTDVLLLSLYFSKSISCPIYQKSGTQNRTRYIDVGKLATALGDSVCRGLLGLHAFTGCDSVSAFAGRGKLGALKLLKGSEAFQKVFKQLGEEWFVTEEMFDKLQLFTVKMYASSSNATQVNSLRYDMFCAKRGEVESSQLPPCRDCLKQHVMRANYQTAVWRRSLVSQPVIPDPARHGWSTDPCGNIVIEWMKGSPAPDSVLQLLACKCQRACKLPECPCLANDLKCTSMCRLSSCDNQVADVEEHEGYLIDDSDEYTDDEL